VVESGPAAESGEPCFEQSSAERHLDLSSPSAESQPQVLELVPVLPLPEVQAQGPGPQQLAPVQGLALVSSLLEPAYLWRLHQSFFRR